jgi:hypothetical protein
MQAMFHSKYFVYPFLPSSPSLMRTILMGVVIGREEVLFPPDVQREIKPEGVLMLVFRLLTALKRDEQVLLLLLQQSELSDGFIDRPLGQVTDDEWMFVLLDPQSWLVLLTWIYETCSTKTFLLACLLCPSGYHQGIFSSLQKLVMQPDEKNILRVISSQSGCFLIEYLYRLGASPSFERTVLETKKFGQGATQMQEWFDRAA